MVNVNNKGEDAGGAPVRARELNDLILVGHFSIGEQDDASWKTTMSWGLENLL